MRVRIGHNLDEHELAKALSGVVVKEGVAQGVLERLEKSDHNHEPIPERYVEQIYGRINKEFRKLLVSVEANTLKWLLSHDSIQKSRLRKAGDPPVLSEEQLLELRRLIEGHFRYAIGMTFGVTKKMMRKWTRMGIELPNANLEKWIIESYVAGRLADILHNSDTYAEMKQLAGKLPMSREDELAIMMAKQNAARFITGYGKRLADVAEDVALQKEKAAINKVIQAYFKGNLQATGYGTVLQPNELGVVSGGWRELASELRKRFRNEDLSRDWDRVAQSEIRYATNLGKLMSIQSEGGGDPEDIEVYFHVQSTACKYCKQLYLNPDGTPRIFKLSEILHNVSATGGMQIGLSASKIGEEGGWVPNAVCHPYGHCYPVRRIPGYSPIPTGTSTPVGSGASTE